MAKEFDGLAKEQLASVAQGLLEMKKMARSLENSAEAFTPLTEDELTKSTLLAIMKNAQTIAAQCSQLYLSIAKEALSS